jgi:hypothetical protein
VGKSGILQYLNHDAPNVVLMQDERALQFVGVGEYYSSDFTLERYDSNASTDARVIRPHPEVLLPFPVVDTDGKVVYKTLGDAFEKKLPVWWMEGDAVATCVDGAMHSP